jgi:hypothetical protein
MGLDMYLKGKRYLRTYMEESEDAKIADSITQHFPEISSAGIKVTQVECELGYWRKANAIHAWFVRNVQNGVDECQESWLERSDLEKLLEAVNTVIENPKLAGEILPPQEGFFFGNTDIDQYYIADLKYTRDMIERILKLDSNWDFYYRASW